MASLEQLLSVCKRHVLKNRTKATVREPYVPYIPAQWNKVLVLAEAQNHAQGSYLADLRRMSPRSRLLRLYKSKQMVGVHPWDNGTLKLAVEAALKREASRTAVSNAVPWSLVKGSKNQTPSPEHLRKSVAFWLDLLPVLQPELILVAGAKAEEVVRKVLKSIKIQPKLIPTPLPSPRVLNAVSRTFDEDDLMSRFPEVRKVIAKRRGWLEIEGHRRNKILFACLVVSRASRRGKNLVGL